MPDLMIAQRHTAHLDRVAVALRQVHESDGYPMVWPEDPVAWLTPEGSIGAWVALADGAVVGHVMLVAADDVEQVERLAETAGVSVAGLAAVSRLFVTPKARGSRIASALLERVEDAPTRRGRRLVLDVVDDGGPAVRLYDRLGWRRVATGPAAWTGPDGTHPEMASYLCPR